MLLMELVLHAIVDILLTLMVYAFQITAQLAADNAQVQLFALSVQVDTTICKTMLVWNAQIFLNV